MQTRAAFASTKTNIMDGLRDLLGDAQAFAEDNKVATGVIAGATIAAVVTLYSKRSNSKPGTFDIGSGSVDRSMVETEVRHTHRCPSAASATHERVNWPRNLPNNSKGSENAPAAVPSVRRSTGGGGRPTDDDTRTSRCASGRSERGQSGGAFEQKRLPHSHSQPPAHPL